MFLDPISRRIHDDPKIYHISLVPSPFRARTELVDATRALSRAGYEKWGSPMRYSKSVRSLNPFCGEQYVVTLTADADGALVGATGDILKGCL